ncbi:hypothetical protein CK203_069009 [Vitis vinifera]|uniref:Uncharacterized protein n=1 Tax=Vitis vinifera TaxID=29760 RepID=A0A438F139_VITVI|nr:hypothetical protein CK203_069009 [Vitis vinifera]
MKHMIERPSRPHDPTVVSSSPSGPPPITEQHILDLENLINLSRELLNLTYCKECPSITSTREICPRSKQFPRGYGEDLLNRMLSPSLGPKVKQLEMQDMVLSHGACSICPRCMLFRTRVEADSLQHLSARYCPLMPPPRSTIAAAFSPDGKNTCFHTASNCTPILFHTHSGDHTVKIIDCHTGSCLKVLNWSSKDTLGAATHKILVEVVTLL